MKGIFFQKPFELVLNVQGEKWNQGDPVQGSLVIKNPGTSQEATPKLRVILAYGELKKVRAKSPEAFSVIKEVIFETGSPLDPKSEVTHSWTFATQVNDPITDSADSLFLLYGQGDSVEKMGQLQLIFAPHLVIQEFINTLVVQYRFVVKTIKSNKGKVEIKFAPPSAKGFATLDQLVTYLHFDPAETTGNLEVRYVFNVKKIQSTATSFDVTKDKKELKQSLLSALYKTPSGRFAHDYFEKNIQEALALVESKVLY